MIDGITILSTKTEVLPNGYSFVLFGIGIITVIAGLYWTIFVDTNKVGFLISFLTVGFILILIGTFGAIFLKIPGDTIYEVIIDDSVSMTDFMNSYEILEKREDIYTIKEIKPND